MLTLAPARMHKNANYRTISGPTGLLANLQPFEGNSMHAHRYNDPSNSVPPPANRWGSQYDGIVPATAVYVVWSYVTPIAWVDADGTVIVPDQRYSVTTSKQQGYCRAWLGWATPGTSRNAERSLPIA